MDHATKDIMDAAQRALQAWQETHPDAIFAEIETAVEQHLNAVPAQLVGELVDRLMTDEHPICRGCGSTMLPRSESSRKVVIQGNASVELHRTYVVCPACGAGLSPLDERCKLLPGQFSPYLVEAIVRLGTALPFERVPQLLFFLMGVHVSVETVRRLSEWAGAAQVAVEQAAYEQLVRDLPPVPEGPAVQQISADGAMAVLPGRRVH